MSKESEPVRSRRELRAAHSEETSSTAGTPPVPAPPAVEPITADAVKPPLAVAETPQDDAGAAVPGERSSQTRARDRAALRAYKELLDAPAGPGNQLPSRRALRQAQLDAERAPVTSINTVVPPAAVKPAPTRPPTVQAVTPATDVAQPKPPVAEPAAGAPATAAPIAQARTRAGRRSAAPAAPGSTSGAATSAPTPGTPVPGSNGQAPAIPAVPAIAPASSSSDTASAPAVSMPMNTVGPGVSAGQAPSPEELRLLAEQRAQAEREAVLKQRAQARERLAQENAKNRRPASDPTATNNLAMVTPLEFVNVPGVDRPVLRPPVTTHVPIVTKSTPKQSPARRPAPKTDADRFDAALSARSAHRPGPGTRPITGNRSNTLKRAQAMVAGSDAVAPEKASATTPAAVPATSPATTGEVTRTQMPPMPADYAHGLEPLDAVTAGLGRTQRNMLIQWASIILGGAALIAGAVMIITGLAR
ncbi:MAG: hypothetical protein WBX27_19275 [Specibacter sp.]